MTYYTESEKIKTTIGNVALSCAPQNLTTYQAKIAKPPKGGTRQSKEPRKFPKHADALVSTQAYVREYLRLNGLAFKGVAEDEYILNTAPTTWPEGPDCIVEIDGE